MEKADNTITVALLKARSGEFDIESIHSLDLQNMGLSSCGCLGECSGLERLNLANNDVSNLYALAGLSNLIDLNLSANRLVTLEGLQTLDSMKTLNVAGNLIASIDSLRYVAGLENLKELRLRDTVRNLTNPICSNPTYKEDMLKILPDLQVLDGIILKGQGNEVFTMCDELDELLKERDAHMSETPVPEPQSWVPDGFWRHDTTRFENSSLADAEKQLEDLLAECQRMSKTAIEKINKLVTEALENT